MMPYKNIAVVVFSTILGFVQSIGQESHLSACQQANLELNDTCNRTLSMRFDALAFFENDEFTSPFVKGYTLPGCRLTPTLRYCQNQFASLEVGAYLLHYWGANTYPNTNYFGIPIYSPEDNTKGFHALPFIRARLATNFGFTIVLGNLYGSTSHRLIAPLYAKQLDYTADPEAGIQILYSNRWIDADAWVDWRTFIFNQSPYCENFLFGLALRGQLTRPSSALSLSVPVQLLMEHIGGEIDTTDFGISTLLNAAAGLSLRYNFTGSTIKSIGAEACGLVSRQVAGNIWPMNNGKAIWAKADIDIEGLIFSAGIFHANKFQTLCGLPLFGTLSTFDDAKANRPTTIFVGLEYTRQFAPGFSLCAHGQMYALQACDIYGQDGKTRQNAATSFTFGASIRINPSFLIKKF